MKAGIADKVRAAGGEVFAISSEPQGLAARAQKEWGLDFQSLGDPHHEIADGCRERGWLDLFVNPNLEFLVNSAPEGSDFRPTHPKGYFQPGVLALTKEGRVLYRWRGVPKHSNMGGATERPTAEHVHEKLSLALGQASEGDVALDDAPPLDSRGVPWPIFVSLLIANGWFVEGKGFGEGGGLTPVQRIKRAGLRIGRIRRRMGRGFRMAADAPVAIALAGWAAYITPKVRFLNRQFQHVAST